MEELHWVLLRNVINDEVRDTIKQLMLEWGEITKEEFERYN